MTPEELKELQELEELDLLEKQYGKSEEPSMLKKIAETTKDFGTGTSQGLSFGFADEIVCGLKGTAGALAGEGNYQDLYAKYRDIEREKVKEAEERSPIASMAGDITGSILPAIVTGGGSLAPAAARIGLKQAAKMGAGQLAKTVGAKTAVLAAEGALQGVGRSEAETIPEIAEEAYESGKSGVLWGTGLGLAGEFAGLPAKVSSKMDDTIEDSPFLRQTKMAYEKGKAGESITGGRADVEKMAEKATGQTSDIVKRIMDTDEQLGKAIRSKITDATNAGAKISADSAISEAADSLSRVFQNDPDLLGQAETQKVLKQLLDLQSSQLSPEAAFELRRRVVELSDKVQDPRMKNIVNRFQGSIKTALESQVEGLADASAKFKQFRQAVPETLMSKGLPSEFSSKWYGDVDNKGEKLFSSVDDLLKELNAPGARQLEGRTTLAQMKKQLNEIVKKDPEIAKQMGFENIDDFYKKIEDVSDETNLRNMILGYEPQAGFKREARALFTGDLGTTLRSSAYGASQLAGKTVKAAKESAPGKLTSYLSDMSRNVYKASNDQLGQVSQKLQANPKTKALGDVLGKALENKASVGKDAALFTIMQNPDARRVLEDFDFGFDTDED